MTALFFEELSFENRTGVFTCYEKTNPEGIPVVLVWGMKGRITAEVIYYKQMLRICQLICATTHSGMYL